MGLSPWLAPPTPAFLHPHEDTGNYCVPTPQKPQTLAFPNQTKGAGLWSYLTPSPTLTLGPLGQLANPRSALFPDEFPPRARVSLCLTLALPNQPT